MAEPNGELSGMGAEPARSRSASSQNAEGRDRRGGDGARGSRAAPGCARASGGARRSPPSFGKVAAPMERRTGQRSSTRWIVSSRRTSSTARRRNRRAEVVGLGEGVVLAPRPSRGCRRRGRRASPRRWSRTAPVGLAPRRAAHLLGVVDREDHERERSRVAAGLVELLARVVDEVGEVLGAGPRLAQAARRPGSGARSSPRWR